MPAHLQIEELRRQAASADAAGFDGVTVSEHHAGFPGYLPQPLLLTALILAETDGIWAGPCPTLLNLRSPALLAEEIAWMGSSFPGRFAAALAPGYAASDFEALGVEFGDRTTAFDRGLRRLVQLLRGEGPLAQDPAIVGWSQQPAPLLSAGNSRRAVVRAAELELGLVYPGGESQERLRELTQLYRSSGGTGPVVWIKAVRIGESGAAIDTSVFRQAAAPGMRLTKGFADGPIAGSADHLADQLLDGLSTVGATGLNVRIHHPGSGLADGQAQIELFADGVLPKLRTGWPAEM